MLFYTFLPLVWICILAALEWGLAIFGYGEDHNLLDVMDPGLLVDNPEYPTRFYSYRDRGEPSQRTNLLPLEKDPSTLRVFVVGGSTAQGYPYQRNHSFTAIAQAALLAVGVDAEIVNLGNSAMTSYYVREVLRDLPEHRPDLVVVYAGHNEYYGTPSIFTGGTHATRMALLRLKKLRMVQLMEGAIAGVAGGESDALAEPLMARRFAESLFPPDRERDRAVADRFVSNLDAGLQALRRAEVPIVVYEPVSNLVSMPPFRSGETGDGMDIAGSAPPASALSLYRRQLQALEAGSWDRTEWQRVRDLDHAPFRARSELVERLRAYVSGQQGLTWIATSQELERRAGPQAFTDEYFIDHLHLKFEGQMLLAAMLAETVVDRFFYSDERMLTGLDRYFDDPERIRDDIHLTAFWELEAYTRVFTLHEREPFASMPLAKEPPGVPERVGRSSLFRSGDFLGSLEGESSEDLFYLALDHYRAQGDRAEWIANMNAYVHLFPGHHESHLAYGIALLEEDARALLQPAGSYIRRAYHLSGRDPEVAELAREELRRQGLEGVWEGFRARYLE